MSDVQARLLNDFQRDFPLEPEPYRAIAETLGITEPEILALLARCRDEGRVSRVGVVFRPNVVGVSTLAALAVPERDLAVAARAVSELPEVNHNYEREHRYNLWFVVAAPDADGLARALGTVERRTGLKPLVLPLVKEYHIDLGFDMGHRGPARLRPAFQPANVAEAFPAEDEPALVAAVQGGFPLASRPFAEIAILAGMTEREVIARLRNWVDTGVARRVGIVVRHHELGYRANAMVVWDVPDFQVDAAGRCVARQPFVTLCYRRPRKLPDWRHNLFCMIHGRDRNTVLSHVETLRQLCGLGELPHEILFSRQRFKQTGARYAA
jgi:DNA-binding Lrp family transcriptional regulator